MGLLSNRIQEGGGAGDVQEHFSPETHFSTDQCGGTAHLVKLYIQLEYNILA